jgi:hypothetical protein
MIESTYVNLGRIEMDIDKKPTKIRRDANPTKNLQGLN